MSDLKVSLKFIDGMSFTATSGSGHETVLDVPGPEYGGKNRGPTPKELVLEGLAGCTGMDVISLMDKMRVNYKKFEIEIKASQTETHPKVFSEIKIIYKVHGKNLNPEKIQKAIDLSMTKYCGVSAMLSKTATIAHELKLVEM